MKVKAGDLLNLTLHVKISITKDLEVDDKLKKDIEALIYNHIRDIMEEKNE